MTSETRFLAMVTALLMLWVVSVAIRESGESLIWESAVAVTGPAQPSDIRLKEDVHDLTYGLRELLGLQPVSYRFKDYPSQPRIGLIAQEVQSVVPEVVYLSPERRESLQPRYYSINYGELVPLLIGSIQEQQVAIESLQERIGSLEVAGIQ
ncbi:MAG TPA: tail fiber domain-containing protein [Rhodothermia bacterium]